jgi:zinc/manganese transport system substrate-binding protein
MRKTIVLILLSLGFLSPAFAALRVVATLPWIGSIVQEIGGDHVEVTVLIKANQDPHYAEAKPSMILAARKADVLMFNGLDLEIGYLPRIIESSSNPKIQPGKMGNLDCSQFIEPIEKPTSVDRSMGDVHPLGNPHYQFSPKNILKVAEGMASVLSEIDPGNAAFYDSRLQMFKDRMKDKEKEWSRLPLQGKRFIAYHKLFEYLAEEYGFRIEAYIEPKPGIPPSAGRISELIEFTARTKPDAILATTVAGRKEAEALSQRTGVPLIILPQDVGAMPAAEDWFGLMDEVFKSLH